MDDIETIVAAAILYEGEIYSVPSPARHDSVCHLMLDKGLPTDSMRLQGFVTSTGRFVDRKEANTIARDAKQLIRKTDPEDILFSEDVW